MTLLAENPIPTRYTLLGRLKNWDDQDSWKDFFDTYWRLIYAWALKSGLTESEAQDVVQETIISVAKDIQKFNHNRSLGSFKGWLRNIIRWRIADQMRKRMLGSLQPDASLAEDTAGPPDVAELADPAGSESESLWEEEWEANLAEAAMRNVKQRVKEEHFQMFDLYVVRHWPVSKVAETLGVSVGMVYLAKHRVSALIRKEVRRLEARWG